MLVFRVVYLETPMRQAGDIPRHARKNACPASVPRDNVEELAANCRRRNSSGDPHHVAALYDGFVVLKREADELRQARNENAAAMKVCAR